MDRRYGLDAITYLTDPPRGPAARPVQKPSPDQVRSGMHQRAAMLRRELEELEAKLRTLDPSPKSA